MMIVASMDALAIQNQGLHVHLRVVLGSYCVLQGVSDCIWAEFACIVESYR